MTEATRQEEDNPVFAAWGRRAILLVTATSIAAMATYLLFGADLSKIVPIATDSYGPGVLGHRALSEFLEARGYHILQNRGDDYLRITEPLLLLEPSTESRVDGHPHRLREALLARRAESLPTLVALPKWEFSELAFGATTPRVREHSDIDDVLNEVSEGGTGLVATEGDEPQVVHGVLGEFVVDVPNLRVWSKPPVDSTVLLESERGALLLDLHGVLLLTDPDILHSYNLQRGDHADLALTILTELGATDLVVLDETFHGHGVRLSLGEVIRKFPNNLILIHLLLLLGLAVWTGTFRFGRAKDSTLRPGPRDAIRVAGEVLARGESPEVLRRNYVVEQIHDLHRSLKLRTGSSTLEKARELDEAARSLGIEARAELLLSEAFAANTDKNSNRHLAGHMYLFRKSLLERSLLRSKKTTLPKPTETVR